MLELRFIIAHENHQAASALLGIFFGDELAWACISWTDISAAVDLVRHDLPRGTAILYQNEAFPIFTNGVCGGFPGTKYAYPSVPAGLDWFSIDYYPNEGTLPGARRIYEMLIYPKVIHSINCFSLKSFPPSLSTACP